MNGSSEDIPVRIRGFRREDQPACRELYVEGLVGGKIAPNDTGLDMDDIEYAYLRSPGDHFWVAEEAGGRIVGMIGVQHHDDGGAEIRRLRVARDRRGRGIGTALMETAVRFCQERAYLKVTLDTYMEREPAIALFQKFRFRHERSRSLEGKELHYFYLDLYTGTLHRPPP